MQGNIISLICNSCGCGQTEAQEYLDSEIRYLRELQEADDLRVRSNPYEPYEEQGS